MEIDLNNPDWQQVAALMMHKLNKRYVSITPQDLQNFEKADLGTVTIDGQNGTTHLRLVSMDEAAEETREASKAR